MEIIVQTEDRFISGGLSYTEVDPIQITEDTKYYVSDGFHIYRYTGSVIAAQTLEELVGPAKYPLLRTHSISAIAAPMPSTIAIAIKTAPRNSDLSMIVIDPRDPSHPLSTFSTHQLGRITAMIPLHRLHLIAATNELGEVILIDLMLQKHVTVCSMKSPRLLTDESASILVAAGKNITKVYELPLTGLSNNLKMIAKETYEGYPAMVMIKENGIIIAEGFEKPAGYTMWHKALNNMVASYGPVALDARELPPLTKSEVTLDEALMSHLALGEFSRAPAASKPPLMPLYRLELPLIPIIQHYESTTKVEVDEDFEKMIITRPDHPMLVDDYPANNVSDLLFSVCDLAGQSDYDPRIAAAMNSITKCRNNFEGEQPLSQQQYYRCIDCDIDLLCTHCALNCHKSHTLVKMPFGFYGEKCHCFCSDAAPKKISCPCGKIEEKQDSLVQCPHCQVIYHLNCVGLNKASTGTFICIDCADELKIDEKFCRVEGGLLVEKKEIYPVQKILGFDEKNAEFRTEI